MENGIVFRNLEIQGDLSSKISLLKEFNQEYEGFLELSADEKSSRNDNIVKLEDRDSESNLNETCHKIKEIDQRSSQLSNSHVKLYEVGYNIQSIEDKSDLYSPTFTRGKQSFIDALCPWCNFIGNRVEYVFNSKSYRNHMNLIHGISSASRSMYPLPQLVQEELQSLPSSIKKLKDIQPKLIKKGLCIKCKEWIEMECQTVCHIKNPFYAWWRHCQVCYDQSASELSTNN